MTDIFRLHATADRSLAWKEGDSIRHIVATIEADNTKISVGAAPPVNLAIVVDASGSMQGGKIAAAKQAVLGVIERMRVNDRLTLVSFASDAVVHIDRLQMNDIGRRRAAEAVHHLGVRGNTNLSEGWLMGAERLAAVVTGAAVNRIILLSDGMANEGITDRRELAAYASSLAERGICTSTVGIGDGYELPLLRAIAEHGGGNLHDAERNDDLVNALAGELGEIANVAAQKVTLTLAVPADASATLVGSTPSTAAAGSLSIFLGNILSARPRTLVFRVRLPAGQVDQEILFGVTARGSGRSGEMLMARPAEVGFTLVEGSRNNRQLRDEITAMHVARAWQAHVVQNAADLNRSADRHELRRYLEGELRHFTRYVEGLDEAKSLLGELALIRGAADRIWDERTRKEMGLKGHHDLTGHSDYRRRQSNEEWQSRLSGEQ